MQRRFPDFLIIGAGKSGTTSLDNYLKQHPGIFIPEKKEPNFFAYKTLKREEFADNKIFCEHYDNSVTNLEDYLYLFEYATRSQIIGETSNVYLHHPSAAEQIKKYIPDVKIIVLLRDPSERLYSRYLHLARDGRLLGNDIDGFFNRDSIWWKRADLIPEGFYYKNLSKFMSHFRRDQLHVILYDDFISDVEGTFYKLFSFLDVDVSFVPNTAIRYNQSGFIKNKFVNQFISGDGKVLKAINRLFPAFYQYAKQNKYVFSFLNKMKLKNLERPILDSVLKKRITEEIYGEDINALASYLDVNLSKWK